MELSTASFDNIPDTLFKSGKPKHTNSNRANSQRCTILTAVPADEVRVSATKLHRWSRGERARILSSVPEFFDVTDYAFDDQFPRPASAFAAHYLSDSSISRRFSSLLSNASGPRLLVASVARNYIGFRDEVDSSCHCLHFANKEDFLTGLGILSSDLFFQYWLTVGDGFHLTKTNILNFPISESVEKQIRGQVHEIDAFWKKRHRFEKVKFNSGKKTRSYDFSSVSPRPVQVWR
jgi:hypothetical protein